MTDLRGGVFRLVANQVPIDALAQACLEAPVHEDERMNNYECSL